MLVILLTSLQEKRDTCLHWRLLRCVTMNFFRKVWKDLGNSVIKLSETSFSGDTWNFWSSQAALVGWTSEHAVQDAQGHSTARAATDSLEQTMQPRNPWCRTVKLSQKLIASAQVLYLALLVFYKTSFAAKPFYVYFSPCFDFFFKRHGKMIY